jgi:hypothetical protein
MSTLPYSDITKPHVSFHLRTWYLGGVKTIQTAVMYSDTIFTPAVVSRPLDCHMRQFDAGRNWSLRLSQHSWSNRKVISWMSRWLKRGKHEPVLAEGVEIRRSIPIDAKIFPDS